MEKFTRDANVADMFKTGYSARIAYKVQGFWSMDTINIYAYIDRAWNENEYKIKAEISRSSGGRDTDEVASESEAARNYAEALLDAAELVDLIHASKELLVANYKAYRAEIEAEREQAEQARIAKFNNDKHIKTYEAVWIAEDMKATADRNGDVTRRFRKRGTENIVVVSCMNYGKARFYIDNNSVSRKEAVTVIAQMAEEV